MPTAALLIPHLDYRMEQMGQLQAAIEAGGPGVPPITIKARPGEAGRFDIIDGNHRALAARQAGLRTVPAIVVQEGPAGSKRVPSPRAARRGKVVTSPATEGLAGKLPPCAPKPRKPKPDLFARLFASQLLESLGGGPATVFVDTGEAGKGSNRWSYTAAPSQNADWFQELTEKCDRKTTGNVENCGYDGKSIVRNLGLMKEGKPVKTSQREGRWLVAALDKARVEGWEASLNGKPWVGQVPPEKVWRKAAAVHRVCLVMPETEYEAFKADASAVHQDPKKYLRHVVERWQEIEAQAKRELE